MAFVRNYYLIIIIFLAGLALRLYDLGTESIWYDEAISIAVAKLGLIEQIQWSFYQNDNNPLFYYEFLHFWIWIFGDSEFVSRLPSALFGSLSVVAIYLVGKSLFNKNVGLLSALILAVSDFHIKYSQEARAYSLLALFTLLSFYFFLKLTRSKRRWYLVGYLVSTALMLYTHYYGFFILAAQNIFFFANYFKSRNLGIITFRAWIISQIILFISYLPGFLLFAKHTIAIQGGFWLPEPNLFGIVRTFAIYSGSAAMALVLTIFSLIAVFGYKEVKNKIGLTSRSNVFKDDTELPLSSPNRIYLLLLWLFVPLFLPYLISLISTPVLLFRYTIGASLAFYILSARGIEASGRKSIMILLAVAILISSYFNLKPYYDSVDKFQWRESMSYIEENASPGDYITVFPKFEIESANYYKNRDDVYLYSMNEEFILITDIGNKDLWFVLANHARTDREAFEQTLGEKYQLLGEKEFKSLNLYHYRKRQAQ